MKKEAGFTLIELMVVLVIVGLLFGTILSATNALNRRGRDTRRQSDISKIRDALQEYYADNHFYPPTTVLTSATGILTNNGALTGSSGQTYMGQTPNDPGGSLPYCYTAQIAQTVSSPACDNSVSSTTKCEYYQLCASLEVPPLSGSSCTCNGHTYNLLTHSP